MFEAKVSQSQFEEERRLRLDAEKRASVAERLAEERQATINDWRRLYDEEVKARAADRQWYQEDLAKKSQPIVLPPFDNKPVTADDVRHTAVSTKRGMRERKLIANDLEAREMNEADRAAFNEKKKRLDESQSKMREVVEAAQFDPELGALFVTSSEPEATNADN